MSEEGRERRAHTAWEAWIAYQLRTGRLVGYPAWDAEPAWIREMWAEVATALLPAGTVAIGQERAERLIEYVAALEGQQLGGDLAARRSRGRWYAAQQAIQPSDYAALSDIEAPTEAVLALQAGETEGADR